MTEDQMLENLQDPLVAEEIDPERLSTKNIERLFAIALADDGPSVKPAIDRLRLLYLRLPDYRPRVLEALQKIAKAQKRSRRTRKQAARIYRELTMQNNSRVSFLIKILKAIKSLFLWPRRMHGTAPSRHK